ncbi:antitoxin of toxin-antitoxin stability system%2C StbD family protein [Vibrio cholerae]|nr:antitoxin of toxin-antitoxin stability system%2C StbD family protein [Vibrio cholerae]
MTVPLEAFVKLHFQDYNDPIKDHIKDRLNVEDLELLAIAKERLSEDSVSVNIDDL